MDRICLQCNKEFKAVRATAKFCSALCRVKNSRLSVTLSVTKELSVTEPERVKPLLTDEQIEALSDDDLELYCRYVDEPFSFVPNWIAFRFR